MHICPDCAHEWSSDARAEVSGDGRVVKDAHGNWLQDGDSVTVISVHKPKGLPLVVKVGAKVRNTRQVDGDHGIDRRIDGGGAMKLKSDFVKKA